MIVTRRESTVRTGEHDLRILRRRRDPTRLAAADVVPIARSDSTFSRATRNAHGRIVLLRTVYVVRKIVVERDAIKLRRGLILLGPTPPAVVRNVRATVVAFDHAIRIVWRDPQIVIVAVRH